MWKTFLFVCGFAILAGIVLYSLSLGYGGVSKEFFRPTNSTIEEGEPAQGAQPPLIVAEGLTIPWEIAFLPDGDLVVTERPGTLLRITGEEKKTFTISGVAHRGESGLLGLALHPDFAENRWIYLYLTTADGGSLTNRVMRYTLTGTSLSDRFVVIENIPGAPYHDGGRMAFGPDGMLYITTGDAGNGTYAQNVESLAGKILRVKEDGSIPGDNPFGNAVFSYGHRNVQGITWDAAGQLWATEHGRSGVLSGYDEVNKILKGGNYGWPKIQGDESYEGMVTPEIHSGASETWAPSGLSYLQGHLIFAGLRGESLYAADISSGTARSVKAYLHGDYGRLRTVTVGPDGMFYVLTSNRDGRGDPETADDRIIRIDPRMLGV